MNYFSILHFSSHFYYNTSFLDRSFIVINIPFTSTHTMSCSFLSDRLPGSIYPPNCKHPLIIELSVDSIPDSTEMSLLQRTTLKSPDSVLFVYKFIVYEFWSSHEIDHTRMFIVFVVGRYRRYRRYDLQLTSVLGKFYKVWR